MDFECTVAAADPDLCDDHITDRWITDVRCTADLYEWQWRSREQHDDTDHVPEQASVQQKLWYGWFVIRIPVYCDRYFEPDHIFLSDLVLHPVYQCNTFER